MRYTRPHRWIAVALLVTAMASCGGAETGGTTASGGTGGTGASNGGGTGGTGISSAGTITAFGSVVVNGIHFDETGASVVINDAPGAGDRQGLKIGMTVKIKATLNDDGATASATNIEAEHEVEGLVETVDVPNRSFLVLGQTVYVDDPIFDLSGRIVPNGDVKVEVYGLRDDTGAIHATLIVLDPDDFEPEVRGTVRGLDTVARTFAIGGLTIHYDGTTDFDHGDAGDLVEGATVEVIVDTSSHPYAYAARIEFEDNEDSEFRAGDGDRQEVEGFIVDYNAGAGTFTVDGVPIQMTPSTVLRPTDAGLRNGIPVTVRGVTSSGVVIANEIELH